MKKKTVIIFLTLMLTVMVGLTGCSRDEKDMKDMIEDNTDTRTEQEREGDSSNLKSVVLPWEKVNHYRRSCFFVRSRRCTQ